MKKKIFFLFCFIPIEAISQFSLEKREVQLNAGIGASDWGIPLHVGLDYGIGSNISLGAEASFRTYRDLAYYNSNSFRSTIISFGVNGNYHFTKTLNIPSNWDVYAGLGVGYFMWNNYVNADFEVLNDRFVGVGAQMGSRYFFNRNFGVYIELLGGFTLNGVKIGITHTKL
jgi:outer membrane immunogenic protein